jgi:RHS repeat-associated protein
LNLPSRIKIFDEYVNDILYLYDANGTKLQKTTRMDYVATHTTDYCGNFVYVDDQLAYILTPEGRVVVDGTTFEYQYFLKDHLGNTRITFNENGSIIQEDSYYPFGMAMAGLKYETGTDLPNQYLYNGKELQDDFGLGWYDFHARFYDPSLARTTTQDPHAENYYSESNYGFMGNNPIKNIDPTGMDWYTSTDGSATIWKEGSAEIEGYNNIGAEYTLDVGNGTNIIYNQNEAISMTETVLEEGDWETQREPKYNENGEYVGSKNKAGDEGNCFYQAGKMVENSGAISLLGTANDVNGTADQTGYMNAEVSNGNSVRVHVDYNADGNGDHWVAISSRTTDLQNNTSTYNFYDPGTVSSANGTHSSNTFSVESNSISGTTRYSGRTYTITAVRKNTP